jgi:3-oxoacyl-[acyl-carrier protein] reductase
MKTVLITGSSRGIGRETAIYFAQQGWNVIIHGFRHPEKLESLKNEILEENVSCLSFCGDISDPSFVDEMIKPYFF